VVAVLLTVIVQLGQGDLTMLVYAVVRMVMVVPVQALVAVVIGLLVQIKHVEPIFWSCWPTVSLYFLGINHQGG
jgi:hypothetical protein